MKTTKLLPSFILFISAIFFFSALTPPAQAQNAGPVGSIKIKEESGGGCASLPFYTEFIANGGIPISIFIGRGGNVIIHIGNDVHFFDSIDDFMEWLHSSFDTFLALQEACFYLMSGIESGEGSITVGDINVTPEYCHEHGETINDVIRILEEILEAVSGVC